MLRQRLQGILSFLTLVAICTGLGYLSWLWLSRPPERPGQHPVASKPAGPDSLEFFSVAGEGVELEVISPGGLRTSSLDEIGAKGRIPGSDAKVDCPGFASPEPSARKCTASIQVRFPAPGDYRIVASGNLPRRETLNVGWSRAGSGKGGAFDVPVQVAENRPSEFIIIVGRETVTQRTSPR